MKNLLYLFSLIFLPGILFSQSSFDLEKSKIKWTGKKITTESHWGSLYFSEANLFFDGSDIIKGKFIVDMNSMTVDDIQGRGKERLENHLRNDDFFGVSNHKEAILEFDSKSELSNGEYSVDANLTIKGITNPVVFKLKPKGDSYTANLIFDRTKFNVNYRSGNFFENLGDRLILDEVELAVTLVK